MNLKVHIAQNPEVFEQILQLRYEVLRAPWQQSKDSATDEHESQAYNAFILSKHNSVIACGRLQKNENAIGQIRFMAVDKDWQGKGLGQLILASLEKQAKAIGCEKIELQARENALDFYLGRGYHIDEKSFLLWNQIQHYKMSKSLLAAI